jgi:hypothetical protein
MRRILQSDYFYPIIILLICLWRIFTPQLPSNEGLGWDGYRYYSVALDALKSRELDTYLVFRIFPSLFVHAILSLARIEIDPAHVILGFKLMNLVLLTLSALMVRRIFSLYRLSSAAQLIGFIIIYMNYGVLNFTFYYPVMTDTPTFFLSVALFYFFTTGQLMNVLLIGLIGAFTWPVLFPMALALLLFPNKPVAFMPVSNRLLYTMCSLSLAYGLCMAFYLIFIRHETADMKYTLPISYELLPFTFIGIGFLFFFIPCIFCNKLFFTAAYYKSLFSLKRIVAAVIMLALFIIVRSMLHVPSTAYMTVYSLVRTHFIYALQRPFTTFVNHFNYYGVGVLIILIFWKRFSAFISTFGLGVAAAIFVNLFFFSMKPESRAQIHHFPWLLILISLYIGKYRFTDSFYAFVIILNIILARLWFFFEFSFDNYPVLPDSTICFPEQWFFMNLGMYMTASVWLGMFIITIVCIIVLTFIVYSIKFENGSIVFYPKFQLITETPGVEEFQEQLPEADTPGARDLRL